MTRLTASQKEILKKAILSATIQHLTTGQTVPYIKQTTGLNSSYGYVAHLKADLVKDSQKQLDFYHRNRFALLNETFFKRLAELEHNQEILHSLIEKNKEDKPDTVIRAVAQLNETTVLIANLFNLLPNLCNLGVDALNDSTTPKNTNDSDFLLHSNDSQQTEVNSISSSNRGSTLTDKEIEEHNRKNPEWSI